METSFHKKYTYFAQFGIKEQEACNVDASWLKKVCEVPNGLILDMFKYRKVKKMPWSILQKCISILCDFNFDLTNLQQSLYKLRRQEQQLQKNKEKDKHLKLMNEPFFTACNDDEDTEIPIDDHADAQEKKLNLKVHNLRRQIKRRNDRIEGQNKKIKLLESAVATCQDEMEKERIDNQNMANQLELTIKKKVYACMCIYVLTVIIPDKVAAEKRSLYHKRRRQECGQNYDNVDDLHAKIAKLESEIETLNVEVTAEQNKVLALKEKLSEIDTCVTYADGKYTDKIRECYMSLLSLGVSASKIDPAIRTVLKLVNKSVERLPSATLAKTMALEAGILSKVQLGEVISMTQFNTLHTDGTTKFGEKYATFNISTIEGSYSLALCDIKSGSATDALDTLDNIIEDIDEICSSVSVDMKGKGTAILTTIKNTMSDRHSAEKKFNSLLEEYRGKILSQVKDGWEFLTSEEKSAYTKLNNFFCGLHLMVAMADQANNALIEAEKVLSDGKMNLGASKIAPSFCSSTESGTVRLIRTVCNAVQKHGSQRAGAYIYFDQFLKGRGIETIPLATFRGNRFNIVFYDSAGVHYLLPYLIDFFQSFGGNNPLLKSVKADLNEPLFHAGCKALGLINKLVTGPLWRIFETNPSIKEINKIYTKMRDKFYQWSLNSCEVLEGANVLFDADFYKPNDTIFQSLMKTNSTDEETLVFLQVIFKAFYLLCDHMLTDHLPGGVHDDDSEKYALETESVPKTNTICERDFALLDRFIRERPNSSTIAIESLVLFSNNRTRQWLESKSESEKAKLFQAGRKLAPKFRRKYQKRREEIRKYRAKQLLEREKEKQLKEKKEEKKRKELIDEIMIIGLWQTIEEVEKEVKQTKSAKQKEKKLKTQLKFRKHVLLQSYSDKNVFNFSKKGKKFTITELKSNLCLLVSASDDPEEDPCINNSSSNADPIISNPRLLVGRHVQHRFLTEEENEVYETFNGVITSQVRVGRNKSFFNIKYDGFEERYWTYELLDDYKSGDLTLV